MTDTQIDKYRPLKDAFGRFATGVAIASCWSPSTGHPANSNTKNAGKDGRKPVAITINSFTSVSLEPPLVLWCLEKRASTYDDFMGADHYGISILDGGQEDLSNRFASFNPKPLSLKEMGLTGKSSLPDAPLLNDCLAALNCLIEKRIDAGDHIIMLGRVENFKSVQGKPLIYFASQYMVGPHSDKDTPQG